MTQSFDPQIVADSAIADSQNGDIPPQDSEIDPEIINIIGPENKSRFQALQGTVRRGKAARAKKEKVVRALSPAQKRRGALVRPLMGMYVSIGTTVMAFDANCGMAVVASAENCAKALDELAQTNEAIRRALYAMVETGAWGALMFAHLPIILAVVLHHAPQFKDNPQAAQMMEAVMQNMLHPPKIDEPEKAA